MLESRYQFSGSSLSLGGSGSPCSVPCPHALRDQHDMFLSVFPGSCCCFPECSFYKRFAVVFLSAWRTRFFNTSSTFSVHPDLAQGPWEACPSFEDLSSLAVPPFCLPGSSGQNSVPMCAYTPSHLDMSSGQVLAILHFVLSSYLTASSGQISDPASPSSCAALASPVWHFVLCHRGPVPSWSSCHPGWSWSPGHPPVSSQSLVELASFFTFCFPCSRRLSALSPQYPQSGSLFPVMGSGSPPVLLFPGSVLAPDVASSFLLFALGVDRSFRVLDRISQALCFPCAHCLPAPLPFLPHEDLPLRASPGAGSGLLSGLVFSAGFFGHDSFFPVIPARI